MKNYKPPIFIIGRQHSGNTMLATILDNHPKVLSFKGEGNFFDKLHQLKKTKKGNLPNKISKIIQESQDPPLNNQKKEKLESCISKNLKENSNPTKLYLEGMDKLVRDEGKSRWVQKATSYIFHIEKILKEMPDAKLIYLARNPLDLGASFKKRHNGSKQWFLRMSLGWNKGTKLAFKYENKYSERFKIVKYENLIENSKKTIEETFKFLNLDFKEKYLDIPHINKAESPYNKKSKERGMQKTKVFYYPKTLAPGEEKFIRSMINNKRLKKLYPDLPPQTKSGVLEITKDVGLSFLSGSINILKDITSRGIGRYIKRLTS